MYLGIELIENRPSIDPATSRADDIINGLRERGILLSTDGPHHNVLKIKPPIVFSQQYADILIAALDDILP